MANGRAKPTILIGVEVGQRRTSSAISIATNPLRTNGGRKERHFLIRTLERLEAGTKFPAVAQRLAELETAARDRSPGSRIAIYANATGFGDPLIDLLNSRVSGRVRPVTFTHGDERLEEYPKVKLGKTYLVSRLQMLLQTHRLHLPKTPQTELLATELLDFEIQVENDANDRYGSFAVGSQDDLVTALGLAVQTDSPGFGVVSGASPLPPGWY